MGKIPFHYEESKTLPKSFWQVRGVGLEATPLLWTNSLGSREMLISFKAADTPEGSSGEEKTTWDERACWSCLLRGPTLCGVCFSLNKSSSYLSLCLSLNSFCDEISRTRASGFPGGLVTKNRLAMQGKLVRFLVWEDPTCWGATRLPKP